jgi:hypothetical protein
MAAGRTSATADAKTATAPGVTLSTILTAFWTTRMVDVYAEKDARSADQIMADVG